MKDFNPYQFVQDRKQFRPFDKDGQKDGNFNYMHEVDVWTLIERMQSAKDTEPVVEADAESRAVCPLCGLAGGDRIE